uniref:Uncharacterized protein n=1 Tax=Tetranychus urticae TaxID=32264 RepID=T1KFV7_TETUR
MYSLTIIGLALFCTVNGQYFNPSGYNVGSSSDFMGRNLINLDDSDDIFRQRKFGEPADFAHSHDNFDREKTSDEIISARINPLAAIINPGLRRGLTGLQHVEARYHKKPAPQRELLRPLLLLTNPSKK